MKGYLPDTLRNATFGVIALGAVTGVAILSSRTDGGSAEVLGTMTGALLFAWLISALVSLNRARSWRWKAFLVTYAVLWFMMIAGALSSA